MSSTSSDDEILGAEAEQEYENTLETEPVETKKPKTPAKRVRLTNSQRLQLIDGFRQGKTDKFYNVIPNKNKPGDYRIVRRRKPLNVPIADNNPEPINMNMEPEPQKEIAVKEEKNGKIKQEFFTMQNTINNSLSKEIAAVMEKCNRIEAKMKKQKQKMREQRRRQPEPVEEEYIEEYDEEEPVNEEPEYRYYPSRFNVRNRIDLRNF